jgi:[protein-PII] uridylyltransferase
MTHDAARRLKKKKDELIARLIKGTAKQTTLFPRDLAFLIDDYFFSCFEKSGTGFNMDPISHPYAIVALGSYGRKEPAIHSDLALMFLFEKTLPPSAEDLIKEFVYPLWDNGFEIAHTTRTVEECILSAENSVDTLIALLDGRFICGMSRLFTTVVEALRNRVIPVRKKTVLRAIIEKNTARHLRFGDASYLVEPNLKEGRGGLSDYDAILSLARITAGAVDPEDLHRFGLLSEKEFADLSCAHTFVLRVRNILHHVTGRKCDPLFLEYQPKVATNLGYRPKGGQEAVERFMGELHGHLETIKQQYRMVTTELGLVPPPAKGPSGVVRKTRVQGLAVDGKSMLGFRSPEDPEKAPELLVKIFGESAVLGMGISVEAARLVRDLAPRHVTPSYRRARSVLRAFEKILLSDLPDNQTLDDMVRTGLLSLLIPEFKGIVNRMQYNEYHLYPVHKHSIMTVKKTALFGAGTGENPLCEKLYSSLEDKRPLAWACLLHDIGKRDLSGNHSETGSEITRTILRRMGYSQDFVDTVAFLVKEHLFLAKTATRRDVKDEETALFCVKRIKGKERLAMLYLLTVADSMSTGPKAWNTWTAALLEELFVKTRDLMGRKEYAPEPPLDLVENRKKTLKALLMETGYDERSADKAIQPLSLRYLIHTDVQIMTRHIRLLTRLGSSAFAWDIEGAGSTSPRTVTIAAQAKPDLFSRLAGLMTLYGFNILDAQIFTLKNNTALVVFHLSPPVDLLFENEKWAKAGEELTNILTHDINLPVRLKDMIRRQNPTPLFTLKKPARIEVDNETSGYFTIIEVYTYDYTGLLFTLTDTLYRLGLEIYMSKIATKLDQVVDIFYVRNMYGRKVDESGEQIRKIRTTIEGVLGAGDVQPP